MDGFSGGYVRMVDAITIIIPASIIAATVIYSSGDLAASVFG